jgi:hypothetical protein
VKVERTSTMPVREAVLRLLRRDPGPMPQRAETWPVWRSVDGIARHPFLKGCTRPEIGAVLAQLLAEGLVERRQSRHRIRGRYRAVYRAVVDGV